MNDVEKLWDAINRYAAACGGNTTATTSNNIHRQKAVVDVEVVVRNMVREACGCGNCGCKLCR